VSASRDKGNRLERYAADKLRKADGVDPTWADKETPGGRIGNTYTLSTDFLTRSYAAECKNRESIGDYIWKWMDGLAKWKGKKVPILIIKRNRRRPLVVIDLEDFCDLVEDCDA
jgi:hypothetical protein